MSVNAGVPFNETGAGPADFAAVPTVQANSPILSADVNQLVEAALRRTRFLAEARVPYTVTQDNNVSPFLIGGLYTSTTYTITGLVQDVANVEIGDDIEVSAQGVWSLNTASTGNVTGRLVIRVVEDFGGANVTTDLPGRALITSDGGSLTLPHDAMFALRSLYRITTAGPLRVAVYVQIWDLSGGAGTGTVVFLLSQRMDVVHLQRVP